MPKARPLSKEDILYAMDATMSNRAAARYMHVSFNHFKKYASIYKNEDGVTLWEANKNQSGRGIPKLLKLDGEVSIHDIVSGKIDPSSFSTTRIKYKLISEGLVEDKCCNCGMNERRVVDYRAPLLLNFKDNNKKNFALDNLEMYCYNCYFLYVGDVFSNKQIDKMEDYAADNKHSKEPQWELDSYHFKRLKELGLEDPEEKEINKLISRDE